MTDRTRANEKGGRSDRAIELVGALAAVVLAIVVNLLAARHYRRWDWTENARYTLSAASLATLADLDGPVDVWVIAPAEDPEAAGLRQLLVAYRAASEKIQIHSVDPDRDVLALEDLRRRFRVETGRTEEGRAVTDAMVVVAKGDRHWFITPDDLVGPVSLSSLDPTDSENGRVEPRDEQAITVALRQVVTTHRAKICFTDGHGEPRIDDEGPAGLGVLKDLLEKSNDEVTQVDTTLADSHEPFAGCDVVAVAAPRTPFSAAEEARIRTYLLQGGNGFFALSPLPDPSPTSRTGFRDVHLSDALSPFGIELSDDLLIETDSKRTVPGTRGLTFSVEVAPHAVTASLVASEHHDAPRVVLGFARSLERIGATYGSPTTAASLDLLSTSAQSVALYKLPEGAGDPDSPLPIPPDAKHESRHVALAAEREKVTPSAPHGPRVVVVGSATVVDAANWSEPAAVHGAAFFVENSLSWLAALPPVVDVPRKATVAAGMSLSDASRSDIRMYVLFYMPAAVALLGLAIGLRRRATEGVPRASKPKKKSST